MIADAAAAAAALSSFIAAIHDGVRVSWWFRVFDSDLDNPDNVASDISDDDDDDARAEKEAATALRKQRLAQLQLSSLQLQTGLTRDQYNELLKSTGLLHEKGGKYYDTAIHNTQCVEI